MDAEEHEEGEPYERSTQQNRTDLIGAACIGAATCAFVWFAFQFAPGEPRELTVGDESYASSIEASGNSRYVAEGIVDILRATYKPMD